MDEELHRHLEECARLMMAPSGLITPQQLKQAEETFLNFQKTKQPFEICRSILESNNSSPYVKYQAATCLKSSIIREWSYLKENNRHVQLLQYLLDYVTSQQTLGHFIREQLLLVAAILLKRIGIEESGNQPRMRLSDEAKQDEMNRNSVVSSVLTSIISMQTTVNQGGSDEDITLNVHRMFIATQYLLAVLFEYSSSTRTSDFGIPWIKHLEAKKKFERNNLKLVFSSTLEALNKILHDDVLSRILAHYENTDHSFGDHNTSGSSLGAPPALVSHVADLYLKSLELLEMIFTWNFDIITIISSQYATHVDSIEVPSFQPNIDWREMLINEQVISFLYFLYSFSRNRLKNEKMVHHSLQILSQLSSLTGAIICDSKIRVKFVNLLLTGLINVIKDNTNSKFESFEVVSISTVLYRLSFHLQNRDTLEQIDRSVKASLSDIITKVSCEIFEGNLRHDQDKFACEDGSDRYKQSVENICSAWAVVLQAIEKQESDDTHKTVYDPVTGTFQTMGETKPVKEDKTYEFEMLRESARQVFTCYLKCHLTKPEGLREVVEDSDEIEEFEEDDTTNYNDQLNTIGSLARLDLKNSIDDLSNLLMLRIGQLQNMMVTATASVANNDNNNSRSSTVSSVIGSHEWCCLNEDIHWLILISTWTLSQSTWLGDRDLIPDGVTTLSITSNSDITATVEALKTLEINQSNLHTIDPIVRLIVILFKFLRMEQISIENNLQIISPEVSSTISTFVAKFMSVYLMPQEDSYNELSMALISCFGKDTPSSVHCLEFVIKHLAMKISSWSTEASVREEAASVLVEFVKESRERCQAVVNSTEMNKLIVPLLNNQMQCYTVQTRKSLYQLIVLLASSSPQLYDTLFMSLKTKYTTIQSLTKSQDDLNELNRLALIEMCDCLIGITQACNPENTNKLWSECLGLIYCSEIPKLMGIYHNYSVVIVSLLEFVQCVTCRVLCFLPQAETLKFYEASIEILKIYAKSNSGRFSNEATTMDELSAEIILIMVMLNDLSSKDFIDWFPPNLSNSPSQNQEPTNNVSAIQIVFLGLDIVMPLLSTQLLQYPSLSVNYYKLVTYLCEDSDRLAEVPEPLFDSLMASLRHALKSTFSSDIKNSCLSTIYVLSENCLRLEARGIHDLRSVAAKLEPFLEVVFTMTLEEHGSTRDVLLREHIANALFSLIRLFPTSYNNLIEHLIVSQKAARPNEPELEAELRRCFTALTAISPNDVPTTTLRCSRTYTRTMNAVQGLAAFRQKFEVFVSELLGLLKIK